MFEQCSGFRALFAEIAFSSAKRHHVFGERTKSKCLAETILLNDCNVWKDVRKSWIKIVIQGILRDYEPKLHFSRLFIRNYEAVMDGFMLDDQEDDASITSLTVQIFTVKSIAHKLP